MKQIRDVPAFIAQVGEILEERIPFFPKERLFYCMTCSAVLTSPAGLSDGSDIRCANCDSEPGMVEPCEEEQS